MAPPYSFSLLNTFNRMPRGRVPSPEIEAEARQPEHELSLEWQEFLIYFIECWGCFSTACTQTSLLPTGSQLLLKNIEYVFL